MTFAVRQTLQELWNEKSNMMAKLGIDEVIKQIPVVYPEWSADQQQMAMYEMLFAESWVDAGRITYELTHGMASLLVLTSAATVSQNLPHEAFTIKVPREFFPLEGQWPSPDSWIAVAKRGDTVAIFAIADSDTTAEALTFYVGDVSGDSLEQTPTGDNASPAQRRTMLLARRLAANAIAYILEHQDCVIARPGKRAEGRKPATYEVRPPREVVIDKEFRAAAKAAVSATTLVGIRRALRHVVRGHWRNQAVGTQRAERRRTWIKPHKRGDETLGSVVARLERMRKPEEEIA